MTRARRPSFPGHGVGWSANRRIALAAGVIAVLIAVTAAVAFSTGRADHNAPSVKDPPAAGASAGPTQAGPSPAAGAGPVAKPPPLAEPVAFAKAAALMLWSYDTRTTSREQHLAGMRAWMSTETKYTDWNSLAAQVPDPLLWSRMADQDQRATATVSEGHYPSGFKQALAEDPSAITEAYIYAVTVNGKQQIAWKGGGGGAEDRAVTLAVQCHPGNDCTLAAIAPTVTQ
ncbi:hypothetical protein V1460_30380 [Streptomyces sp. SCSIO 30461]|uniref:hypothetical protein n=1 Tax=Streptomyces sp. SCSIO 30461 TaxID=3118085 RepID=UPI0030CD9593